MWNFDPHSYPFSLPPFPSLSLPPFPVLPLSPGLCSIRVRLHSKR